MHVVREANSPKMLLRRVIRAGLTKTIQSQAVKCSSLAKPSAAGGIYELRTCNLKPECFGRNQSHSTHCISTHWFVPQINPPFPRRYIDPVRLTLSSSLPQFAIKMRGNIYTMFKTKQKWGSGWGLSRFGIMPGPHSMLKLNRYKTPLHQDTI